MASNLAVDDWEDLVKEQKPVLEADKVTKALELFAAKEKQKDHEALIEAVGAVITKAQDAKKKNKSKDKVVKYLDKMLKEAEAARKEAEKKLEAEGAEDEEEGGEGVLLYGQLKKALNRKPEDAKPFVVALGKVCGLVLPKGPALSGEHKKRARAMRVGSGKLLEGRCYGEAGKFVFEFEIQPANGLAKAIKKAVLIHCDKSIKVKVKGPAGEFDDENDQDELTDLGTDTEEPQAGEASTGGDDLAERFKARAREIKTRLDAFREVDAGRAAPLFTRYATALGAAQANRHEDGLALLNTLSDEITAAERAAAAAANSPTAAPLKQVSTVVLQQTRLAWESTLKKVDADRKKLTAEMVARFQGESDLPDAQRAADRINQSLELFNQDLSDALDKAYNAETPEARGEWHREAVAIVDDYLAGLDADEVLGLLDTNPYLPVSIYKTLSTALKTLKSKLA